MVKNILRFILCLLLIFSSNASYATRAQVRVVGSSTLFPLVSYSAEEFVRKRRDYAPVVVEANGTANGFKLFCAGFGANTVDIVGASRKITAAEKALCERNQVSDILEIKLGYDGIVIANSKKSVQFDFSKMEIFLALSSYVAKDDFMVIKNPNHDWSDVNDKFPEQKIEVYGPKRDTGTYESVVNSIFLESCVQRKAFRVKYSNRKERRKACSIMRDDGAFIEVGNDENLIVQKIVRNPQVLGIFSYSFLMNNDSFLQGSRINGVEPNYENIASGRYVLSRPLYLYVKLQNLSEVSSLSAFLGEITNEVAIGKEGYLISEGLIPLSDQDLSDLAEEIKEKVLKEDLEESKEKVLKEDLEE